MAIRMSHSDRERFLAGRHVAVLVTIGADGRPVPTPIWYRYRDGLLYFRTETAAVKAENIRGDPRVSVCVQEERPPYKAVVVYGTAEVREELDWLGRELPRHYLGFIGGIGYQRTQRTAQQQIERGPEVTLVVRPERFVTLDYTSETPLVGRLWLSLRRVLPPWL